MLAGMGDDEQIVLTVTLADLDDRLEIFVDLARGVIRFLQSGQARGRKRKPATVFSTDNDRQGILAVCEKGTSQP